MQWPKILRVSIKELPLDNGKRIVKVLESMKRGWTCSGKSEKNHFILKNPALPYVFLSIPDRDPVDRNTLRTDLKKANIDDCDFAEAHAELFGKGLKKDTNNVHELAFCPLCREFITPADELTKMPDNDLMAHKACHEKQFGTA